MLADALKPHFAANGFASGTHRPYLLAAVLCTTGPILELGMGPNSTPALHEASELGGRDLYSVDNDKAWASEFFHLRTARHRILTVAQYDDFPYELCLWDVVLVDQSPGAERAKSLHRLCNHARIIVCHDSEGDPCYGYEKAFLEYRYVATYSKAFPWTSIVSNFVDVREWALF